MRRVVYSSRGYSSNRANNSIFSASNFKKAKRAGVPESTIQGTIDYLIDEMNMYAEDRGLGEDFFQAGNVTQEWVDRSQAYAPSYTFEIEVEHDGIVEGSTQFIIQFDYWAQAWPTTVDEADVQDSAKWLFNAILRNSPRIKSLL